MTEKFLGLGTEINGILQLTPKEAYQCAQNGAIIVDIRADYETDYKQFNVPEVIYIPVFEFKDYYEEIPKGRELIIGDSVGLRSREIISFLKEKGYNDIANIIDGIVAWERDGLPL